MPLRITLTLSPREAADPKMYLPAVARQAGVREEQIACARIVKRSVDARRGRPKVNLTVELYVDPEKEPEPLYFDYPDVTGRTPVAVVGAGPAGLFAALRLIELGVRPLVLERGREVSARKRDVAQINRGGAVDPDSNYAFGEGGAGTFSDGKLFTRSKKRGDYHRALQLFVAHGADPAILHDAHPHIGSDRLPGIITRMRETILHSGGEIFFSTRVTAFRISDGRVTGVEIEREGAREVVDAAAVILAAGHSAQDIYETLHAQHILLEAKPFAMGVRVEHPQTLIDTIQYRMPERGDYLPAASYSLVTQVAGRGVYSFCMCPGGFIVPAMTAADQSVVNGMSPSGRNSIYANAGIVAEVRAADVAHLAETHGPLAGLRFQRQLEELAHRHGAAGQVAPAQRLSDFVTGKSSKSLPPTSYIPGIVPSEIHAWLPPFIGMALRAGFQHFGKIMRGYLTHEALLLGVESRTSSPVRIPRDPATGMHPQVAGLFPCGEGAGYAGGILSAALDGEHIATQAVNYCN